MIHVLYWIKASKALPKIAFDSKKLKSIININSKNNANAKEFNSKNTEKVGYNKELIVSDIPKIFFKDLIRERNAR